MRSLVHHPITHGEACSAIQEAQEMFYANYKKNLGHADGLALLYAEQFIRENKEAFDKFTQKLPGTE